MIKEKYKIYNFDEFISLVNNEYIIDGDGIVYFIKKSTNIDIDYFLRYSKSYAYSVNEALERLESIKEEFEILWIKTGDI